MPYNGARIVIRHNTIINSQLEIYRPGMSQGLYGCQSAEIYDNAFSAVGLNKGRPQCIISIGAGVNIVFNNTVTGTTYNSHEIRSVTNGRAVSFRVSASATATIPSTAIRFPRASSGAGYPCMGQPGRATDADGDGIYELDALLCVEQHVQWGETAHGGRPSCRCERTAAHDQGRA